MKLNNDCIRDILLFIEETTDNDNLCVSSSDIIDNLTGYKPSEILYHIREIDKYKYVTDVSYSDDEPDYVGDLSPQGRNFVNNVRNNNVWESTKKLISKLGSASLPVISSIAEKELIKFLNI